MDNEKNQLIERIVGLRIKTNKAELGIHSLLRLWGFKGERPRLEPVPHYNSFNHQTDSELVYPPKHKTPKIQRNKATLYPL